MSNKLLETDAFEIEIKEFITPENPPDFNKLEYTKGIYKSRKKWRFVIIYKPNPFQKSKRIEEYGFDTEQEARDAMRKRIKKIKRNRDAVITDRETVGYLIQRVIKFKFDTKEETTSYMEMLTCRKYVYNEYKFDKIKDFFTDAVLQELYKQINNATYYDYKTKCEKKLSTGTKNKIFAILRSCMEIAKTLNLITEKQNNLFKLIFIGEKDFDQDTKKELACWTPEQIRSFFEKWEKDLNEQLTKPKRYQGNDAEWWLLLKLLFRTGIRFSECISILVEKVDLVAKTLKIDQQSIRSGWRGKMITKRPKSKRSKRIIDLDDDMVNDIAEYIKTKDLKPNQYLFFGGYKPISAKTLSRGILRYMKRYAEPLGLPILTAHQIRSTVETILMDRDLTPRQVAYVARRMGHSEEVAFRSYINTKNAKCDKVMKVF